MGELTETLREAITKTKIIAIQGAARMAQLKIDCPDPAHDERWCATCEAMEMAADIIRQRILSLLEEKPETA